MAENVNFGTLIDVVESTQKRMKKHSSNFKNLQTHPTTMEMWDK